MVNHKFFKHSVFLLFNTLSGYTQLKRNLNKVFSLLIIAVFPFAVWAQSPEKNFGVISEIIMSSECLPKPNYNLFFESYVDAQETEKGAFWYKLAFVKDCFIKLTLVPNNESDRYNISLYSTKRNERFCDEHEKIDDIEEVVTFNDNYQPETFRSSIFYSKAIEVFDNEAIYIFINNQQGVDSGHILEIQTCDDYSYILKVNKPETQLNIVSGNTPPLGSDIPKKLCEKNDEAQFGYISFSNDKIVVNNFPTDKIDSVNTAYNQSVAAQHTHLTTSATDSTNNLSAITDTTLYKNFNEPEPYTTFTAKNSNVDPRFAGIFKLIQKIPNTKGEYRLDDSYSHYLHEVEAAPVESKKTQKTPKGPRTKRTGKKITKEIPINFVVINTENGKVLKQCAFKLLKESGLRPISFTYNDSVGVISAEIGAEETYRIECDLIGYKNYAQKLDPNNKIVIDSIANYIIPLTPLKAGDKFVIPNIYFHPNAPAFKEQSFEELNKLAKYMDANTINILIAGHSNGNKRISKDKRQTDESLTFSGSAKKLSKKRAEAVRDYLVKSGIDKNRIAVKGYGGKKPIVKQPKNKREGEKNMRVEIFITKF